MQEVRVSSLLDTSVNYETLSASKNGQNISYLDQGTLHIISTKSKDEFTIPQVSQSQFVKMLDAENLIYTTGKSVYFVDLLNKQKTLLFANDECSAIYLHAFKDGFIIVSVSNNTTDFAYYTSQFKSVQIQNLKSSVVSFSSNLNDVLLLLNNKTVVVIRHSIPRVKRIKLPETLPNKVWKSVAMNCEYTVVAITETKIPSLPGYETEIHITTLLQASENVTEVMDLVTISNTFQTIRIPKVFSILAIQCVGQWVVFLVQSNAMRVIVYDTKTKETFESREGKNVALIQNVIPEYVIDGNVYFMIKGKTFPEVVVSMMLSGFNELANNVLQYNGKEDDVSFIRMELAIQEGRADALKEVIDSLKTEEYIPALKVLQQFLASVSRKERTLFVNGRFAKQFQLLFQKTLHALGRKEVITFEEQYDDCVDLRKEIERLEKIREKKEYIDRIEQTRQKYKVFDQFTEESRKEIHATLELVSVGGLSNKINYMNEKDKLSFGNIRDFKEDELKEMVWKYVYFYCKNKQMNEAYKLLMKTGIADVIEVMKVLCTKSVDVEMRRNLYELLEPSDIVNLMKKIDNCPERPERHFQLILNDPDYSYLHSDLTQQNAEKYGIRLGFSTKYDNGEIYIGTAKQMQISLEMMKLLEPVEQDFICLELGQKINSGNDWNYFLFYAAHGKVKEGVEWMNEHKDMNSTEIAKVRKISRNSTMEFSSVISHIIDKEVKESFLGIDLMRDNLYTPYFDVFYKNKTAKCPFHWMDVYKCIDDVDLALLVNTFEYHVFPIQEFDKTKLLNSLPKQFPSKKLLVELFTNLSDQKPVGIEKTEEINYKTRLGDCRLFELYEFVLSKKHFVGNNRLLPYIPRMDTMFYTLNTKYYVENGQAVHCMMTNTTKEEIEKIGRECTQTDQLSTICFMSNFFKNPTMKLEVLLHELLKDKIDEIKKNPIMHNYVCDDALCFKMARFEFKAQEFIINSLCDRIKESPKFDVTWNLLPFLCSRWQMPIPSVPFEKLAAAGNMLGMIEFSDHHRVSKEELLSYKWGDNTISVHGKHFIEVINDAKERGISEFLQLSVPSTNFLNFVFMPVCLQSLVYTLESLLNIAHKKDAPFERIRTILLDTCVESVETLYFVYKLFDSKSPLFEFLQILVDVQNGFEPSTKNLIATIKDKTHKYGTQPWALMTIEMMMDKMIEYYETNSPYRMELIFNAASELTLVEEIKQRIGQYEATKHISFAYSLNLLVSTPSKQLVQLLCQKKLFEQAYDFVKQFDMGMFSYVVFCEADLLNKDWDKIDALFVSKKVVANDVVDYYGTKYNELVKEKCVDGNNRVFSKKVKIVLQHKMDWLRQSKATLQDEDELKRLIAIFDQCEKENVPPESILTPTEDILIDIINMGNITISRKISETIQIEEATQFEEVVKFVGKNESYEIPLADGLAHLSEFQTKMPRIAKGIELFKIRYMMIYKYSEDKMVYFPMIDSTFMFFENRTMLVDEAVSIRVLSKFSMRLKDWEAVFDDARTYIRSEKIPDEEVLPILSSRFVDIGTGVQPVVLTGWQISTLKKFVSIIQEPEKLVESLMNAIDDNNIKLVNEVIQCSYCASNISNSSKMINRMLTFFNEHVKKMQQSQNLPYLIDLIVKTNTFEDFVIPTTNGPKSAIWLYLRLIFEENKDYKKLMVKTHEDDTFLFQMHFNMDLQICFDTMEEAVTYCHLDNMCSDMFGYLGDFQSGGEYFWKKGESALLSISSKLQTGFFKNPSEGVVYLLTAARYYNDALSFFTMDQDSLWANRCYLKSVLALTQIVYDNVQLIGLGTSEAKKQMLYFRLFDDAWLFAKVYNIGEEAKDWAQALGVQCIFNNNIEYFNEWSQTYKMDMACLDNMKTYVVENSTFMRKKELMLNYDNFKELCFKTWIDLEMHTDKFVKNCYISPAVKKRIFNTKLNFTF
ncbi:hypothetical protein EIN_187360 [Entamoeba invadens IP1]|uniref:hypothetical protein n=1 Tax=Entamoeba invadens IP1 TaxID=370355 RepID=UPI0002C3F958|nr:hypothetical protein EIN_187360 [Entamoeba invadens IP1]ELP94269.1 hypothetical protein EIN_187360 [Entamoeba invadens IP1]|eukprot:XP_004261040.1 hypothetical protein EIN_187360 [Entamoeba invadens IP1]